VRPLTLYVRPGCRLCEEAEQLLGSLGVAYRAVDITEDAALERAYALRVPVLADGDRVLAEGRVERADLERAMASLTLGEAAKGQPPPG
jgi:glutaredoxin